MQEMSEPTSRGTSTNIRSAESAGSEPTPFVLPPVSPRLKTPTRYGSKTELGLMVENILREGIDRANRER
jgi:hypothetical protein